jgi:tetratricopeptide (TPR) repeat protein
MIVMKNRPFFRISLPAICGLALTLSAHGQTKTTAAEPTPSQKSAAYYQQGVAAENAGDAAGAKNAYEAALAANPRNANAEYHLGQLKLNFDKIATKGRKAKFDGVMVPEFKIDDAELTDALTYLGKIIEKQSTGEITPNFVIQDPQKKLAEAKVSLVLKNTPSGGVLKYILDQVGANARFDEHAIVILAK